MIDSEDENYQDLAARIAALEAKQIVGTADRIVVKELDDGTTVIDIAPTYIWPIIS